MKISFILIGKNEGQRLTNSIKSVLRFIKAESIEDTEIIYIDSCSSDNSITNASKAGADKIFLINGQCNAAIGRNIGAKEAQGEILFFLDGDMELIPGFWRTIVDDENNLVYPFVSGIENDVLYDNNWNYVKTQYRRKFILGEDVYEMTTGGLFCISRKIWNEVGGIDSRFRMNEDLDLGIRLYRKGYPLFRKSAVWVNHHTRFYGSRPETENGVKYIAAFIRKHLFELSTQKKMFVSTYSYWLLLGCLISIFVVPFWIPLMIHFSIVTYRSMRVIQRTGIKLNPFKVFSIRLKKDFKFWWYFLFFWPRMPQLKYTQI